MQAPAWRFRSALPGASWPAVPGADGCTVLALSVQLEQTQWLPGAALRALQFSQLDALARHAFDTVPYYRERWSGRYETGQPLTPERFAPDPAHDTAWNRGAYLVLGPGHCAECHTPRTFYGVLDGSRPFTGGKIGKERIPDITPDQAHGLGEWSASDIATFLKLGMTPDGDFVGSDMAKIVNNGTSKLPQPDLDAIVGYLRSLPAS